VLELIIGRSVNSICALQSKKTIQLFTINFRSYKCLYNIELPLHLTSRVAKNLRHG
jgi:hypothetical protein